MKRCMTLLAVVTAPVWLPIWLPLWLLRRCWRALAALTLAGFLGGCAAASNRFDTSPCACAFLPVNVSAAEVTGHA
ncbi:hypothetical protein CURE108131_19305 [Cupriavidus respiraculi]|uniref:Lipoprotein n=2 Tax=Cupriavidus respiraculi TaxID=195930 RepID=A0ABN7ZDG5_9BURK|nr:hypothetical protein LMG21510_04997 [Cupriavidus respiraculi]